MPVDGVGEQSFWPSFCAQIQVQIARKQAKGLGANNKVFGSVSRGRHKMQPSDWFASALLPNIPIS